MSYHQKHNGLSGFTLIELLVVISIIGIMASIVVANLNDTRARARDTIRMHDMKQISTALEMFYNANGRYPNFTNDGIATIGEFIGTGDDIDRALSPYLNPVPQDPRHDGVLYFYSYDSVHNIEMVNCITGPVSASGVVFGFNRAEQIGDANGVVSRETCSGGDKNLNTAAYNRAIIRSSY